MRREREILDAFAMLADTLVQDFDLADFLYELCARAHRLLDVDAAGVLLHSGGLRLVAASTDAMRELELFELQRDEGPCADSFRSGEQVMIADLAATGGHWPRFTQLAADQGLHAVFAFPLRLRGERIGAMNLLRREPGMLSAADQEVGQALADVAAIGLLHERAVTDAERLSGQLQYALDSRVLIEQAKGILAASLDTNVRKAFEVLRAEARGTSRRLVDVCAEVLDGSSPLLNDEGTDRT